MIQGPRCLAWRCPLIDRSASRDNAASIHIAEQFSDCHDAAKAPKIVLSTDSNSH